jgi:hypothetical protein
MTTAEPFGFIDGLEQAGDSSATRLASACHSMAISVHASLTAGSVAARAYPSLTSALDRYFSEKLVMVMLQIAGGSTTLSVTGNCPNVAVIPSQHFKL